jgi:hypothetical protein
MDKDFNLTTTKQATASILVYTTEQAREQATLRARKNKQGLTRKNKQRARKLLRIRSLAYTILSFRGSSAVACWFKKRFRKQLLAKSDWCHSKS